MGACLSNILCKIIWKLSHAVTISSDWNQRFINLVVNWVEIFSRFFFFPGITLADYKNTSSQLSMTVFAWLQRQNDRAVYLDSQLWIKDKSLPVSCWISHIQDIHLGTKSHLVYYLHYYIDRTRPAGLKSETERKSCFLYQSIEQAIINYVSYHSNQSIIPPAIYQIGIPAKRVWAFKW